MPSRNVLTLAAAELGELANPLRRVVEDPAPPNALFQLLASAGWTLPLEQADVEAVAASWGAVIEAVDAVAGAVDTGGLPGVLAALESIAEAVEAIEGLKDPFTDVLASAEAPTDETVAAFAEDLAQLLVLRWLSRRAPVLVRSLRGLRVVQGIDAPAIAGDNGGSALRPATRQPRLQPGAALELLRDPIGALRAAYAPNGLGSPVEAQAANILIAQALRPLANALDGDVATFTPWGALYDLPPGEQDAAARTSTIGLRLPSPDRSPIRSRLAVSAEFLSSEDTGSLGRRGPGLELTPSGLAGLSAQAGGWTLDLDVTASADTVFVNTEDVHAAGGTGIAAEATLSRPAGEDAVVLGADDGTRVELGTPSLRLAVHLEDQPDLTVEGRLDGAALVVSAGDGDSFVAQVLPSLELRADLDLGLVWSRLAGLRFSGGGELTLQLPLNREIGGVVTLEVLGLTLVLGEDDLAFLLGLDVAFDLGPFDARLEGVGLRIAVAAAPQRNGNLGLFDLHLTFEPPPRAGFSIDIPGVVTGGGFVAHDKLTGRYAGALALDFMAVGIGAVAVVDTRLPNDPDGFALFASIFATFPSLPLGFGFFLSGVGGLVCLNRAMDTEALASGLRDGAIDALLFPDDPLNDAPMLIGQLDSWFPLAPGSTVFGIAASITWGTPKTLITGQLGVMLSLPDVDVAVVGSIFMALPDEETAQLELHMDTLGAIDSSERTVSVVASLYDSSLLHTMQLSGDMAMYARFAGDPFFLLSMGGYHPNFEPPSYLPASVLGLRRMGFEILLSDDVWFGVYGYVAVTSNTLQFGASATLRASTKFLGVTYSAFGTIGFDVLLVFSPFSFCADVFAKVEISAGSTELILAELGIHLEGPQPWYATGYGRFEFLGINVRFDFAVGGSAVGETPPRQNVLQLVADALGLAGAWQDVAPVGQTVLMAVSAEDDTVVRARPDADLEVRQTVAPLEREMDVYGIYAIDGPALLGFGEVGLVGVAKATWDPVTDWFAPALYDTMTRVEKLSAPSYESMTAGVRISAGGAVLGGDTQALTPDYKVRVVEELDGETQPGGIQPLVGTLASANVMSALSRSGAGRTRTASTPVSYEAKEPVYTLIDTVTGETFGPQRTYKATVDALGRRLESGTSARGELRVVPLAAARTEVVG